MVRKTGVRIHVGTMSRALALIKARRGKPRPRVKCPWHPAVKTRRLNQIARLVASLPRNEVAVYEDEVDIHLNPKFEFRRISMCSGDVQPLLLWAVKGLPLCPKR
jgi:hypothetical protein